MPWDLYLLGDSQSLVFEMLEKMVEEEKRKRFEYKEGRWNNPEKPKKWRAGQAASSYGFFNFT